MADLADKLLVILERQRELYSEISSLQAELLKRLDDTNQMTLVMDLLARKNQLLDAIHTQIHESAPWVDEWVQKKIKWFNCQLIPELNRRFLKLNSLCVLYAPKMKK